MSTVPEQNPSEASRGASVGGPGLFGLLQAWLLRHAQTFFYALGRLTTRPGATLMTAAVIGIALALPAAMHVMLLNAQRVLSGWDGATQISLFLRHDLSDTRARQLADEIDHRPDVAKVTYISRQQALQEFRNLSGFGAALDALDDNPLPPVIVVQPAANANNPSAVGAMVKQLGKLANVDLAQLDMEWIKRLYALMDIGRRGIWVLSWLLAMAVLLVVGNTIRLMIQNQRDEIIVTKLIGGTDAFIRRPFLYSGFWYGLFGALIALALVSASLSVLKGPVQHLATLYRSDFNLGTLDLFTAAAVLASGMLLGLVGSWLAVGRHLREIEPT